MLHCLAVLQTTRPNNAQIFVDAALSCCAANNKAQQCPDFRRCCIVLLCWNQHYEMQKACRLKASSVLPEYMRLRAKWPVLSFCVSGTVNRQEYCCVHWALHETWPRSLSSTYLCRTSWLCAWKTACLPARALKRREQRRLPHWS